MIKKYVWAILFLFCVLPSQAHADWNTDAIFVHCDEDKNIFQTQSVTVPEDNFDYVKKDFPEGEIFDKMLGVKLGEGASVDILVVKSNDPSLVFRKCTVKSPSGEPRTFTVHRTKIDTGNVQRMCGAAISARFEVRVNDASVATFPSARESCYRQESAQHHPTIAFGHRGLTICENPKLSRYYNGTGNKYELERVGSICRTGSIDSHFDRQSLLAKDEPDEISEISLRGDLHKRNVMIRQLRAELQTERETTKLQAEKISGIESELKALEDKFLAVKTAHSNSLESYETLKSETEIAASKSAWRKFLDRFQRN